ncbi:hypothetical protein Lser_V15G37624 [Lactuca serriola]
MQDSLLSSVSSFHTKKITVTDPNRFSHHGSILETMYRSVSQESRLMSEYKLLPPKTPRTLAPEMQAPLDEVEKPAKRGNKSILKKEDTEDTSSKPAKSKKRKAEKGDSSVPKKVKKMARRKQTPPSHSEQKNELERNRKNNTKTTVKVSVAPPPLTSSQPTSTVALPPPVCTIPISTSPLPPPIISETTEATITSIPIITTTTDSSVNVNTSDVGAKTEEPPKVTP